MFNINDFVFIRPTGDPRIDCFLDQQMTIIDTTEPLTNAENSIDYVLRSDKGDVVIVSERNVEKCAMLRREYRNA